MSAHNEVNKQVSKQVNQDAGQKISELRPQPLHKKASEAKGTSNIKRKIRKFKRDPKLFVSDSKAYIGTSKALYFTWAKFGTFFIGHYCLFAACCLLHHVCITTLC
jgi:hypothetical protein